MPVSLTVTQNVDACAPSELIHLENGICLHKRVVKTIVYILYTNGLTSFHTGLSILIKEEQLSPHTEEMVGIKPTAG